MTAAAVLAVSSRAFAGPPFVTDDPEPVEYRHWELYLASQQERVADGWSGTAPHVEVNYGPVPNLQLHVIVPLAFSRPNAGEATYGVGDTELGAKYRFLSETEHRPEIGVFPLVEVPTGNRDRGLGDGHVQVFVPVWLQKSFGDWTTYGGAGYWFNPGAGNRNWLFVGALLQRRLSSHVTAGLEVFHGTPTTEGGGAETHSNLGLMIDFTDEHHLLMSAGTDLQGDSSFQGYLAYQLTFGPST
ncbi:MAG: hypothetical protein ABI467_18265 [Kofleriaceae bacterium]